MFQESSTEYKNSINKYINEEDSKSDLELEEEIRKIKLKKKVIN